MTRSAVRRTVASFLFLLLSLAALAAAAPTRSAPGPKARPSQRQTIVSSLWNNLVRLWEKEGGSLDPDGKPLTNPRPNEGSSLDPSGALSDNGGSLDPNGAK
ncbi:MAG TPA: hypothetical protein VIA62_14685 [Thermoanaerobaculia bacterium]|jgi:hypothetical protein|nr:hypothetical protein [Thermoanaerobaculia bacterium]